MSIFPYLNISVFALLTFCHVVQAQGVVDCKNAKYATSGVCRAKVEAEMLKLLNDAEAAQPRRVEALKRPHLNFKEVTSNILKTMPCIETKTSPAVSSMGALFSCIYGRNKTIKIFVNENPGTGTVKNIKFMWNDYTNDTGYGVHADVEEVKQSLKIFTTNLIPSVQRDVSYDFFENKSRTYDASGFRVLYTFRQGPSIDERLLTLEPN